MSGGSNGKTTFIASATVLSVFAFFGTKIAQLLNAQMAGVWATFSPLLLPILGTVAIVIGVKHFWSRW